MNNFIPRFNEPSINDLNYINTGYGGHNRCITINEITGSVLPNCTGYAWGRALEILHTFNTTLSTGNAEDWFNYTQDGFERGQTPKLGSIICYSGGDLSGHVAVVEQINLDGSIIISNSAYDGQRFWTQTLPSDYSYNNLQFQGFIYLLNNPVIKRSIKKKFPWVLYAKKIRNKPYI